jgi:putative endonuclease
MAEWFLYILRCRDGSLYTGITPDISRRLQEHLTGQGRGAKYLRGRAPFSLLFQKAVGDKRLALSLEYRIKKRPRAWKEALIKDNQLIDVLINTSSKTGD